MEVKNVEGLLEYLAVVESKMVEEMGEMDFSIFEFTGVNYDELVAVLMQKAGTKEQLIKDMQFLIIVSQIRGANLRMMDRMSDNGKSVLQRIISKYGIVAHKKSVPIKSPTIPRILSLFPKQIYMLRKSYPDKVRTFPVPDNGLPLELAFPGGGAMIKESNKRLSQQFSEWYGDFAVAVRMAVIPTPDQRMFSQFYSRVDESDKQ